ncbi:MAG: M23 family metallopeptidase, partial [Endomicrobiaceae bacterium]|nr:M23 family metallopeptidase [Endomicrobiaceae bacterium]
MKIKIFSYFLCLLFLIFCGCSTHKQEEYQNKQQLDIQAKQNLPPMEEIQTVLFNYGDIFINTFKQTRLSEQDAILILINLEKLTNINKCKPNDYYELTYSDSSWTTFNYFPQDIYYYSLKKSSDNVVSCNQIALQTSKQTLTTSGIVENSLWESMSLQKIKPDVIMAFADIFASKIDFLTEVRKGDTFKIIYEVDIVEKTHTIISSKILAGQYTLSNSSYTAILYKNLKGDESYFDENGQSMKKAFLKAPLQFNHISSFFSKKRYHPILKYYRPHEGIDYAAPRGTPVSAIADGVVSKARPSGGYGNLIILKHPNGYESYYGHLSKYAKGVKRGAKVKQGQVIGYVGSTGVSTGPHLDFRIRKNRKFLNFLKIKMPPSVTLEGQDKQLFEIR